MAAIEQVIEEIIVSASRAHPPHWSERPYLPPDGLGEFARGVVWARIEEELGLTIPGSMIDTMQRPQDFIEFVVNICDSVPALWRHPRPADPTCRIERSFRFQEKGEA